MCVIQHTSLSASLGPGTEGCLWKVMEIRWDVVLLWRYGATAITATSMERPLNICCSLRGGGGDTSYTDCPLVAL